MRHLKNKSRSLSKNK